MTLEEVLSDMKIRDKNDSQRKTAPCTPADDAIIFDNSEYTFEETVEKALEIINEKLNETV